MTIIGSKVAFRTNKNAPRYRVVWIDLKNPAEVNWTTLIAVRTANIKSKTLLLFSQFQKYMNRVRISGTFIRCFVSGNPSDKRYNFDNLFA